MKNKRELRSAKKSRSVRYGTRWYRFEQSWHTLDNGDHFHYVHVYQGIYHRPVKAFSWVTTADGEFIDWMMPRSWATSAKGKR